MTIEAMKQALEALERGRPQIVGVLVQQDQDAAIHAIRAAIEQAEKQEPVAWMYVNTDGECEQIEYSKNEPMPDDPSITPLYTAPRQWQGLTDEDLDIRALWDILAGMNNADGSIVVQFAKAIEAKLKEKNG